MDLKNSQWENVWAKVVREHNTNSVESDYVVFYLECGVYSTIRRYPWWVEANLERLEIVYGKTTDLRNLFHKVVFDEMIKEIEEDQKRLGF